MEENDHVKNLVNALLKTHEDNVRLRDLLERQVNATERIAHHVDTSIPPIMQALGAVREDTSKFMKEEEPTALRALDRFAAWPRAVQAMVIGAIVVIALAGWAGHVWHWVAGGGH